MKRLICIIIFSCVLFSTYAQEKIVSDTLVRVPDESVLRPSLPSKPLFSEESFSVKEPVLFDNSLFNQPLIPTYNKNLDFLKYLRPKTVSISNYDMGIGFFPFITTGKVFNQSTYQLNDKLVFGGNSFGVQSVFDKPKLNPAIQDMSTKGASMFLQYKVSKNFKVEGRVSITNHSGPFEP